MNESMMDRRRWLARAGALVGGSLLARDGFAQQRLLPLRMSALDHLSITVPDAVKAAKFYGPIFDPQVYHERTGVQRYYVRLGTAYLALGPRENVTPFIDHIAAGVIGLVEEDMGKPEIREQFTAAGLPLPTGQGAFSMVNDPDRLQLQLVNATHGQFDTLMPGGRVVPENAVLFPIGFDHIMASVADLEKSVAHYRKLFGQETRDSGRAWFKVGDTRLGLEAAGAGQKPSYSHFCVKCAGFDRGKATASLEKLGVKVEAGSEKGALRFKDIHNIPVEIIGG
jgi:catechol 2,3-dioxygenase-like lactoylglutathione lyase family enzyme